MKETNPFQYRFRYFGRAKLTKYGTYRLYSVPKTVTTAGVKTDRAI